MTAQESAVGQGAEGAVILTSFSPKFFTTGLDLDERGVNKLSSSDGFVRLGSSSLLLYL